MEYPLISVVIPTHQGEKYLHNCISSFQKQTYPNLEIIVVDNASSDFSRNLILTQFPFVRLISLSENMGCDAAWNIGTENARGNLVLVGNDDTEAHPDYVEQIYAKLNSDADLVACSSVLIEDPKPYHKRADENEYYNLFFYALQDKDKIEPSLAPKGPPLIGSVMLFKKEILGNPVDSDYFAYHDDFYVSLRIHLLGKKFTGAEKAFLKHVGQATTGKINKARMTFYRERNRLLNVLLFYEGRTLIKLIPYFLFYFVANIIRSFVEVKVSTVGVLRAYIWLISHCKKVKQKRVAVQHERRVRDEHFVPFFVSKVLPNTNIVFRLINSLFKFHCLITNIPTRDLLHRRKFLRKFTK